jgi:pyruvate dehydrogenase phosphatase
MYVDKFFELMEAGWSEYARVLVRRGDWSASLEGSCALISHVTPGRLVLGNLGDCRAILIHDGDDGTLQARQLTHEHNASRPEERKRILSEHKDEPEAVQYISKSGSWYVKGTLQVTRAIGDLFLKDHWFSNALPDHVKPYVGGTLKTPPYVSVSPEVVDVQLTRKDKVLVIASDGLWDELSNDECVEILQE